MSSENENELKKLSKKLEIEKKSGWNSIDDTAKNEIFKLSDEYKRFLDSSKTEREAINTISGLSQKEGFKSISAATKGDKKLFLNYDNVAGALAVVNNPDELEKGFLIVAAHIDVPRLDLKGVPLYEAENMAYMKTHYYGGIKKYQWVTRALALHGVILLESGEKIDVVIGEDANDPVFTINDLLPHLGKDQMKKNAREVISGEQLNIIVGSIPYKFKDDTNSVKLGILNLLNEKYGIIEEDFVSSELQLVPSEKARDVGFDRSFVGSHGQDDRICSYLGMKALFDADISNKNVMMVFLDKEEIGSAGNTGADSNIIERIVNDIICIHDKGDYNTLIKSLANSKLLSSDVNAGIDPEWATTMEKMNSAKIGYGVCLTKFTGSGGKYNSNEAHAEFVAQCRAAFNKEGVLWQSSELGKVDQGGGGTIAMYLAAYGMDVIDCGTPVLSMHSPFEVASKADIFNTYKAYKAFYQQVDL